MHTYDRRGVLARSIGVITAVAIIVSGVTFAALQSQNATLQGTTITSATANLLIGDGTGGYAATAHGFNFANIEPGGAPMPAQGNMVSFHNTGTSNLALHMAMDANTYSNPQNANIDRVYIILTPVDGGAAQQIPLSTLLADYTSNKPENLTFTVAAGQISQYKMQVQIAGDAVTSTTSGIAINGINLIFSGTSVIS